MGWTQAACDDCWTEQNPLRKPNILADPEPERCCYCGAETVSGIYVREDPATVPYPS